MMQLDGTPLPNGMLRWFGYDFDRVELPNEPLLRGDESPQWVGSLPGFNCRIGISDAKLTIDIDEFDICDGGDDEQVTMTPRKYWASYDAHGFERTGGFIATNWHDVQQKCQRLEEQLDESYSERHSSCRDDNGDPTEDACSLCEV